MDAYILKRRPFERLVLLEVPPMTPPNKAAKAEEMATEYTEHTESRSQTGSALVSNSVCSVYSVVNLLVGIRLMRIVS